MKILVFGHRLEVGGTQVNAIELSIYLRDVCGHQVTYLASPGPMNDLIDKAGIRFLAAPDSSSHPSPARMRAIDRIIRSERPDVVHIWDWPQWLDAFLGVRLLRRVPIVVTCMSMVVPSVLPKRARTTFGTPELVDRARTSGYREVDLIMPPVDIRLNAPDRQGDLAFRRKFGIGEDDILFVTVSRLVDWMKAESIRKTMEAMLHLDARGNPRFAIVGDGTSRAELEAVAARINAQLGRPAIVFTGALLDPRAAYAAADVVIGMGGSALRGMAFEKPVIVTGEQNFSALFTLQTRDFFYWKGMYGEGDGKSGSELLVADMNRLLQSPEDRHALGRLSRSFVEQHYGIDAVGQELNDILNLASSAPVNFGDVVYDTCRTASLLAAEGLHFRNPWRALSHPAAGSRPMAQTAIAVPARRPFPDDDQRL